MALNEYQTNKKWNRDVVSRVWQCRSGPLPALNADCAIAALINDVNL